MNTTELIEEITTVKDLSRNRSQLYYIVIPQYEKVNNMTLQDLLDEADGEEEKRILLKHRRIKKRLLKFRQYCLTKMKKSSASTYMQVVIAVYHYYEIETPNLPQIHVTYTEQITDIPTHNHVKQVLELTTQTRLKAVILFMYTSGCSVNETIHLTLHEFIDATNEYHHGGTIRQILSELSHNDHVVPIFHIVRLKTGIPYYTFCTPEATTFILKMLQERLYQKELHEQDLLFEMTTAGIQAFCRRANDKLEWGWKGSRRFFHPHALRKLFATTLLKQRVDPFTVHFLLGHHVDTVTSAYLKVDPQSLKIIYMEKMGAFSIYTKYEYNTITSTEKQELKELKDFKKKYESRLEDIEALLHMRKN